jgi:hypothetical protein
VRGFTNEIYYQLERIDINTVVEPRMAEYFPEDCPGSMVETMIERAEAGNNNCDYYLRDIYTNPHIAQALHN